MHIALVAHGSLAGPNSRRLGGRANWEIFCSRLAKIELVLAERMAALPQQKPIPYTEVLANVWACADLDSTDHGTRVRRFRKQQLLEISTCIPEHDLQNRGPEELAVAVAVAAVRASVAALAKDGLDYSSLNELTPIISV